MSTQTINISLPKDLIEEIDEAAKKKFATRSGYIRQALVGKLKLDRSEQDEWDLLEALSIEITKSAEDQGYKTNDDFVRAVKEVRRNRLTKATKQ